MIFGLTLGLVYAKYRFGKEGENPKIDCTCGPVHNGRLQLCGYRIHHWMIATPLALVSFNLALFVPWAGFLGCWDLMTFSSVMAIHGLTYSDRFDTSLDASEASESELSECLDSETDSQEYSVRDDMDAC